MTEVWSNMNMMAPALGEVLLFVVPTKYEDFAKSDEMVYVYKTHERDWQDIQNSVGEAVGRRDK